MRDAWTPLSSTSRYAHGRLTLREDTWRLHAGRDGEITESVSKVTLLQYAVRPRMC